MRETPFRFRHTMHVFLLLHRSAAPFAASKSTIRDLSTMVLPARSREYCSSHRERPKPLLERMTTFALRTRLSVPKIRPLHRSRWLLQYSRNAAGKTMVDKLADDVD